MSPALVQHAAAAPHSFATPGHINANHRYAITNRSSIHTASNTDSTPAPSPSDLTSFASPLLSVFNLSALSMALADILSRASPGSANSNSNFNSSSDSGNFSFSDNLNPVVPLTSSPLADDETLPPLSPSILYRERGFYRESTSRAAQLGTGLGMALGMGW